VRAGKLDRRITIESATETQDTFGEFVPVWSTFATEWAEFEPQVQRETADEAFVAEARAVFRVRYRSDITTKMRIVHDDGLTYAIEGIAQIGRREGLALSARVMSGA